MIIYFFRSLCFPSSKSITRARERASESAKFVSRDDTVDRSIRAGSQEQESDKDQEDVEDGAEPALEAAGFVELRSVVSTAHAQVCDAPEDEAEERVEERAHERKQVAEEGDHFGDDEGERPQHGEDAGPACPAGDGVRGHVAGVCVEAEEEETRGDGGVEDTQEDDGRDHEAEADFEIDFVAKGAESRRHVVLVSSVDVDDAADEREDDDFGDGNGPKSLGEVLRVLHFGDEGGQRDLTDEGIADVHESVHARNEWGTFSGYNQPSRLAKSRVFAASHSTGMVLNASENGGQDNRDECEECGEGCNGGKRAEGTRQRTSP